MIRRDRHKLLMSLKGKLKFRNVNFRWNPLIHSPSMG
jgi:hypothetical protein